MPIGQWFTVSAWSGSCAAHGMRSRFYLGTSLTDRGSTWGKKASISDYWSSAGTRTYYGAVARIDAAGNTGKRSESGSASIRVYTPAPSNPTWVSATGSHGNMAGSGWMFNYATVSAGGSSYVRGYTAQENTSRASDGRWRGWRSNYSCTANSSQFQGRAQAYGDGGTSGWSYTGVYGLGSFGGRPLGGVC